MLALIAVYYTGGADTPFERFMDSQWFGVRFLFTLIGMIINVMWVDCSEVGYPHGRRW